nr:MAG TPA: hypothetical protein [Caudoviricetes sp.]
MRLKRVGSNFLKLAYTAVSLLYRCFEMIT